MHIIVNFVSLYVHLIIAIAPYMISGSAVYLYFRYKEETRISKAAEQYAKMFDATYDDARSIIKNHRY